jgi:hypothetical protein
VQIVDGNISIKELNRISENMFGKLVKGVVDIKKEIMAIDAELHSDQESLLLEEGSKQENLWGINLYPERIGNDDWIEFDSMINLRPSFGNKTRGVDDSKVQEIIKKIVNKLVVQ